MFIGQRQNASLWPGGFDATDAVIAWADNANFSGPDNMVFNFLNENGPTSDLSGHSLNGREIMRVILPEML